MMWWMPVYDDLRQAIEASGLSRYQLWKQTGISQAHLSQFMAGKKGLSVEALEQLAGCLDLEVVARPVKQKDNRKKQSKRKDG